MPTETALQTANTLLAPWAKGTKTPEPNRLDVLIHAPRLEAFGLAVGAAVEAMEAALPDGAWPNWVLGNHDESRVATRLGEAQARTAMMLLLTLRGTPTIYNGDELGMTDVPVPPEQVQDPFERRVPGLGLGREQTSGKECFPCIVTTGDMVKFTKRPEFDRDHYAFFMGGSGGPCRFGQYNALQRMILEGTSAWFDDISTKDRVEGADEIFYRAAVLAAQKTSALLGDDPRKWLWGKVHTLDFVSPIRREGWGKGLFGGGSQLENRNVAHRADQPGIRQAKRHLRASQPGTNHSPEAPKS